MRVKSEDFGERLRLVVLPGYSLLCWAYVSGAKESETWDEILISLVYMHIYNIFHFL